MTPAAVPELDLAFSVGGAVPLGPAGPLADPRQGEDHWRRHLGRWLADLVAELPPSLRAPAYSLGLVLTDDAGIAQLNADWRHRQGPTDVLAFAAQEAPLPAAGGPTGAMAEPLELGDIVISLETASRQAPAAGHGLEEELLFLASHGLLHLLGWDHPDEASLAAMLRRQERLLAWNGKDRVLTRG